MEGRIRKTLRGNFCAKARTLFLTWSITLRCYWFSLRKMLGMVSSSIASMPMSFNDFTMSTQWKLKNIFFLQSCGFRNHSRRAVVSITLLLKGKNTCFAKKFRPAHQSRFSPELGRSLVMKLIVYLNVNHVNYQKIALGSVVATGTAFTACQAQSMNESDVLLSIIQGNSLPEKIQPFNLRSLWQKYVFFSF